MLEKTTKTCSKCKVEKELSEFYTKKGGKYRNPCKKCQGKTKKKWQQNNPEKTKEYSERWRSNNKEKIKASEKRRGYERQKRYRKNNPVKSKKQSEEQKAKQRDRYKNDEEYRLSVLERKKESFLNLRKQESEKKI